MGEPTRQMVAALCAVDDPDHRIDVSGNRTVNAERSSCLTKGDKETTNVVVVRVAAEH